MNNKTSEFFLFATYHHGYNEIGKAFDNTKLFLSGNPTSTVNIVGHSLGGWQAAILAQQLNEVRCDAVDNLITLDPVSTRYRFKPFGGMVTLPTIKHLIK
uniref:hypothetical protein n=1 Tax=uncultured Psychrobacter sp. TaxID=259303 RepID=UPI0026212D15|nr:hypothetical protein [uncultured Psychrobacter sp.]